MVGLLIGLYTLGARGKYIILILVGKTVLTGLLAWSVRGGSVQISVSLLAIMIGKERADAPPRLHVNRVFVKLCILESLKGPPVCLL